MPRWIPTGRPFEIARRLLNVREAMAEQLTGVQPTWQVGRSTEVGHSLRGMYAEGAIQPVAGWNFIAIRLVLLRSLWLHSVEADGSQSGLGTPFELCLDFAEGTYDPTSLGEGTVSADWCTTDRRGKGCFAVIGMSAAAQAIDTVLPDGGGSIVLATRGPRVTSRMYTNRNMKRAWYDPPIYLPVGSRPFIQSIAQLPFSAGSQHVVRSDWWFTLAED